MVIKSCSDSMYGYNWRCMNYSSSSYQTTRTIFGKGIFSVFKIQPKKLLKALVYMSNQKKLRKNSFYVGVSVRTVTRLKLKIVELIQQYFFENPIRLGGLGVVVNIDERMFHTARSQRGRSPRSKTWAITMVDTSFCPSRGFARVVENLSSNELIPIISSVVRTGLIIRTDEWASYTSLGELNGYVHQTLINKYNFVDPINGVHTQHVESFNNKLKLVIKESRGCSVDKRQG
ncbi:hypothetical protein DMUE_1990 [Dictyocoela muelleri]|nr:hypothetical protein DMUE_1990 [Dictyocoela muelleri]